MSVENGFDAAWQIRPPYICHYFCPSVPGLRMGYATYMKNSHSKTYSVTQCNTEKIQQSKLRSTVDERKRVRKHNLCIFKVFTCENLVHWIHWGTWTWIQQSMWYFSDIGTFSYMCYRTHYPLPHCVKMLEPVIKEEWKDHMIQS